MSRLFAAPAFFALLAVFFSGCSNGLNCSVDARTDGEPHPPGAIIVPKDGPKDSEPFEYREYRDTLVSMLAAKGWRVVEHDDNAARVSFTYQSGKDRIIGSVPGRHYLPPPTPVAASDGRVYYFSAPPVWLHDTPIVACEHTLTVIATKPGGAPVWSVKIRATSLSENLRDVFPYLARAASERFGQSNGSTERISVTTAAALNPHSPTDE